MGTSTAELWRHTYQIPLKSNDARRNYDVISIFLTSFLESVYLKSYLKSTTEGPEGHLYCRKNTETHKKTKKQTNKRYNTENTTTQHTVYSATEKYEN